MPERSGHSCALGPSAQHIARSTLPLLRRGQSARGFMTTIEYLFNGETFRPAGLVVYGLIAVYFCDLKVPSVATAAIS